LLTKFKLFVNYILKRIRTMKMLWINLSYYVILKRTSTYPL